MKKWISVALVFAAGASLAVAPGDVLSFAGGGGLHQVTVVSALSETSFAGRLDGYADTLNASLVTTDDGWLLNADDWKAGCSWNVVKDAAGTRVTCQAKPRRTRRSCRVQGRAMSRVAAFAALSGRGASSLTDGWEVDPVGNEIDILVVYDRTGLAWLSSTGRTPKAYAEAQVAKMNVALANSGLAGDFAVRLCGVYASDVDVTRDCGRAEEDYLGEALQRVVGSSGSKWKAIRAAREKAGADIVMMLADSDPEAESVEDIVGTIGVSAALENDSKSGLYGLVKACLDEQREQAYGVCNIQKVDVDNTFSHEAGHIMGAGHSDLLDPDYSTPGPQLFAYSCAKMYRDTDGERYYTIMGYDSTDGEPETPEYTEIPYFSSPALRHPETGTALGDEKHDNVRTLRETYALVSQFRVNASRRPPPAGPSEVWKKARTLTGVLAENGEPTGVVQLKVGRISARTGMVRVTGSITGRDGRKQTLTGVTATVRPEDDAAYAELRVRGNAAARLDVLLTAAGIEYLSFGKAREMMGVAAGGALARPNLVFGLSPTAVAELAAGLEGLQTDLLPKEEPFSVTGSRWVFGRAAVVRLSRTPRPEVTVDVSHDRTNRAGLKLTYASRTGLFKGTFRAYALVESRGRAQLKKYTCRVTGFVADGTGYGQAVVTRPAVGPVSVTVK